MTHRASESVQSASTAAVPRETIVRAALLGEGALTVFAFLWIAARDLTVPWGFDAAGAVTGLVITAILVGGNYAFFLSAGAPGLRHPAWREFVDRMVRPLCRDLDLWTAGLVSLCAGVGEELFFRGALFTELEGFFGAPAAAAASGIAFGLVHFIGAFRRLWPVVVVYCAFGVLLSTLYAASGSISLLIFIHTLYDWVIITLVRRSERVPLSKE